MASPLASSRATEQLSDPHVAVGVAHVRPADPQKRKPKQNRNRTPIISPKDVGVMYCLGVLYWPPE